MKQNEFSNEVDMLKGNINRMCVTKDQEELEEMYAWAKRRLNDIYCCRYNALLGNHLECR